MYILVAVINVLPEKKNMLHPKHIRTHIPWIIKTVGCGTSHKYTNIQIYSVKYYKYFIKTVL